MTTPPILLPVFTRDQYIFVKFSLKMMLFIPPTKQIWQSHIWKLRRVLEPSLCQVAVSITYTNLENYESIRIVHFGDTSLAKLLRRGWHIPIISTFFSSPAFPGSINFVRPYFLYSQCFLASIVSISVVICVSCHFSFFLLYWNSILSTKIVAKLISFSLFDWGITEKRSFGPAFDSLTFARHVELSDAGWRGYVVKKKIQTMSKSIHHMKN